MGYWPAVAVVLRQEASCPGSFPREIARSRTGRPATRRQWVVRCRASLESRSTPPLARSWSLASDTNSAVSARTTKRRRSASKSASRVLAARRRLQGSAGPCPRTGGGAIKNVVLGPAYLAAGAGDVIRMRDIGIALRRELTKVDRLYHPTEIDLLAGDKQAY